MVKKLQAFIEKKDIKRWSYSTLIEKNEVNMSSDSQFIDRQMDGQTDGGKTVNVCNPGIVVCTGIVLVLLLTLM